MNSNFANVDDEMVGNAINESLPSKPVFEMALNIEIFKEEVKKTLQLNQTQQLEYVLLKIAMEI